MAAIQDLKIATRLSALIVLLLLPIAYLMFALVTEKQIAIDFAEAENTGNHYVQKIQHVMDQTAQREMGMPATGLEEAIAALKAVATEYDAALGTQAVSKAALDALAGSGDYTTVAPALLSLVGAVADGSNLTLDPDLDSYYVMDLVTTKLPTILDLTTRLQLLQKTHGEGEAHERAELLILGALDTALAASNTDIQKATGANALVRERLNNRYGAMIAAEQQLREGIKAGAPTQAAQQALLKAIEALWVEATDVLDVLLQTRIGRLEAKMIEALAVSITLVLLALGLLIAISRSITRPLATLTATMIRLARGELDLDVPGGTRKDELGEIARAVVGFRDAAQARGREEAAAAAEARHQREQEEAAAAARDAAERKAQEDQHQRAAAAARAAGLREMADAVESHTGRAVAQVADSMTRAADTATGMSQAVSHVSANAQNVAAAAQQALANAQTVASATEELSASIAEVTRQVVLSADISDATSRMGSGTADKIAALNTAVEGVGRVIQLISDIAAKTNLLALNATIEAARAGEAGRGFAVVAAEVKTLANQTARSADEINQMISTIQVATDEAAGAVNAIVGRIAELRGASVSIASAMEEQNAATAEIGRNVSDSAEAAREVARRIADVSREADRAGDLAHEVKDLSAEVATRIDALKSAVVESVRSAAPEVNRRSEPRHRVEVAGHLYEGTAGSVRAGGVAQSVLVVDISRHGAFLIVRDDGAAPNASTGVLEVPGLAASPAFDIVARRGQELHARFRFADEGEERKTIQAVDRFVSANGMALAA
ncbi:methyl-accepting chemotaxis protein [Zavarzinia sp. CC-PAN008]|uniref:methyl-accepting chemotaxis protein n=1 Tax=Zavarzinia sp. CC-PAN008 TaxID=3243332 RepID=UPI003F744DAE